MGGSVKTEQVDVGGGVMKWFGTPVTDPNITMVVELGKIIHIRKLCVPCTPKLDKSRGGTNVRMFTPCNISFNIIHVPYSHKISRQ